MGQSQRASWRSWRRRAEQGPQSGTPHEKQFEHLRARYAVHLKPNSCDVEPITVGRLEQHLKRQPQGRAVAACGRRSSEKKDLLEILLDIPLAYYNDIDDGAAWPRVLLMGTVSSLKRGQSQDPTSLMNEDLLAPSGETTRPITNLSPWRRLYSRGQCGDMERCAVPQKEPTKCMTLASSWRLAMSFTRLSNSRREWSPMTRTKFFDPSRET